MCGHSARYQGGLPTTDFFLFSSSRHRKWRVLWGGDRPSCYRIVRSTFCSSIIPITSLRTCRRCRKFLSVMLLKRCETRAMYTEAPLHHISHVVNSLPYPSPEVKSFASCDTAACFFNRSSCLPPPTLPPSAAWPIPPEYNVGLALLRLGKIMSATSGGTGLGEAGSNSTGATGGQPDSSTNPVVDCCIVNGSGGGEDPPRRCLPLTPPWWPVDLDPATGKIPS